MSITKRLSVKAAKPQDQTFALKVQELTEAILDEKTTGSSKAIDDAIVDSMVYGSTAMRIDANGNLGIGSISSTNVYTSSIKPPLHIRIDRDLLENDPMFQLTREQLRAAWLVQYGRKWVKDSSIEDRDMLIAAHRLTAMGEMESHFVDYEPHRRIVE